MAPFPDITITGFDEMELLASEAFTKVISLHDAHLADGGGYEDRIRTYFPKARIVFSYFDDVDFPDPDGPEETEIELLLNFSRGFTKSDRILIHCKAGISRSTALAYAIACQHTKPGQEKKALGHIAKIRPQLFPNRLIVKHAEKILKRAGKMTAALGKPLEEYPS